MFLLFIRNLIHCTEPVLFPWFLVSQSLPDLFPLQVRQDSGENKKVPTHPHDVFCDLYTLILEDPFTLVLKEGRNLSDY